MNKQVPQTPFYGRRKELQLLERLKKKQTASLVVIKGRRRIGKSRLIQEFAAGVKTYSFVGLPPEKGVTAQKQRDEFALQIERLLNVPALRYSRDWGDLFWCLSEHTKTGRMVLVFDEINWMGSEDEMFLGKVKTAWDEYFKSNPKLIFILSGSMSVWIEENILNSTGFLGRVSVDMTLEELPLHQCARFWISRESQLSSYEKFKVLSVTGGVPRYLEEVDPCEPANEVVRSLCFEKEGLLFREFERIFSDLFKERGESYRKILRCLAEGAADLDQISQTLQVKKGGTLSTLMNNLVVSGYVARDDTWSLASGSVGKMHRYRLKDNYLRFYLKYIEPNRTKIEKGGFERPPAWDAIMGLQFENLVLNNSRGLQRILGISPSDIVFDNPFFQRPTKAQQGCQIDYLIHTRFNVIYVCEIKFSRDKIPYSVANEVKEKIERIHIPKGFSCIPVLIHVNGVSEQLNESAYFYRIIDFSDFLMGE